MTGPVDLETVRPQGAPNPDNMGSPDEVSAGRRLEQTRSTIAYALLWILAAVVAIDVISSAALGNACWLWGAYCGRASQVLSMISTNTQTIFTAMIGLVGSVVGFYFGSKSGGGSGG